MGMIKRAIRRTWNKIIPPTQSHQLVVNPHNSASNELASMGQHMSKRKLASLQRKMRKSTGGSKDTTVADALLLAVKNYLPPLQFHHIHGPNAKLSTNKCVARRTQSFCQALVFSNRVILPNERVYIKVLEISKSWSGTIRFGFTAVDPATLACRMPKHACPDMTNAGHTWARALADEVVRRNSVIHFSYNKHGHIHYGINNQDCGIFHANVGTNQNLWFIVDIYGLTSAIELIDPRVNTSFSGQHAIPNTLQQHQSIENGDEEENLSYRQHRTSPTMYKSTSAMDELFGGRYNSSSFMGRRKKMSRKHARHAALVQAAAASAQNQWPLGSYPPTDAMFNHQALPLIQGRTAPLANLNSITLPSAEQNIYSPMPTNLMAMHTSSQRAIVDHDYQTMSNTYSSGSSNYHHQPTTTTTNVPTLHQRRTGGLTGALSMANIAHPGAASSGNSTTSRPRQRSVDESPATLISSQADLSQQLENVRLQDKRQHTSRRHQQVTTSGNKSSSTNTKAHHHQTPVAATRKTRQQPLATNRDQLDKSTSSSSTQANRIISSSSKSASTSPATSNVKPKTRHSIRNPQQSKSSTARDEGDNNNNSPPSKDCPICFERPINCVLYQCGHMCTCYECGVKQWKTQSRTCPICRTVIKDVIKTYMS